ncbi:FtsQ-type POTRA domain-containing protein [uncultured Parolsenella sp.]|uniref:cell division protein FtsQ/DivIB n=1 Tax=uncultured Parolsenella sp. TaxID=2083008 RepID=UPI0027D96AFF|nr:FtsQ-type POTRA domain-containing protein [uncultured Parolsenella sp.]
MGAIVVGALSGLPVFVITGIDAQGSEHVSADAIAKLAGVEEGTTLLNVDTSQVETNVKRNPWVKAVNVSRHFPDTLGISVEERSVFAVVVIGSGSSVWALGDDGVWIEPVQLDTSTTSDVTVAALAKAEELGCLLITNVPSSVDPAQGSPSTDDTIQAVLAYQQQLPDTVTSQAQVYYAASAGSTSLVLKSGLEISLGSPTDISAKAQSLTELMNSYPDQLTYVNVRVPSKPTYRKISGDITLSGASGVVADKQQSATTEASTTQGQTDSSGSSG